MSGKHTYHVESYWLGMKSTFKRINGTYKDFAQSYMDESMWREQNGKTQKLAYINLPKHMAEMCQMMPSLCLCPTVLFRKTNSYEGIRTLLWLLNSAC